MKVALDKWRHAQAVKSENEKKKAKGHPFELGGMFQTKEHNEMMKNIAKQFGW